LGGSVVRVRKAGLAVVRFVSEVGSSVAYAVPTLAERWELLQLEKVHRAETP
jgi:hypothetical protein